MPLRALILNHAWLKLFSLVLAVLIWMAVHANISDEPPSGRKVTREFLRRPVLVLTDNTAHTAFIVEPTQVNVFVQGPANLLNELKEQDVQVFVRLQNGYNGGAVPVRVHVPAGVTVSHVAPLTVTVKTPADI